MEILKWSIGLFHIIFTSIKFIQDILNWESTWYLKQFEISEVIRIQFWVTNEKIIA